MDQVEIQYIRSGATPEDADFSIRAINVAASVAGMDIAPGDIIHMDEHGAVKFSADELADVCRNIDARSKKEKNRLRRYLREKTLEEVKAAWFKKNIYK